jgi:hypothetical protein
MNDGSFDGTRGEQRLARPTYSRQSWLSTVIPSARATKEAVRSEKSSDVWS